MRFHAIAISLCVLAGANGCARPSSAPPSSAAVPAGLERVTFQLDKVP
jgi:hypothetical protein